jgi:hypothetical protein
MPQAVTATLIGCHLINHLVTEGISRSGCVPSNHELCRCTDDVTLKVYHSATFGEILSWLDAQLSKPDPELPPFHAVYSSLADKGYIVRAAFPNLVLREIVETSAEGGGAVDPKQVAVQLRWYGARFRTGFCTRGCYWIPRIPLGSSLLLPVCTANSAQTLKVRSKVL